MHIFFLERGPLSKNEYLTSDHQAHLLGSRGGQFHDTNSVVGSAAFLIKLNVTSQSIYADL